MSAFFALLGPAERAEERRPRRFLVGFKMDRYDPKVDSEPGLTGTPYHDVFGPRAPPRYQLEFDWEVAHPFGSVLVGGDRRVLAELWEDDRARLDARQCPAGARHHHPQHLPIRVDRHVPVRLARGSLGALSLHSLRAGRPDARPLGLVQRKRRGLQRRAARRARGGGGPTGTHPAPAPPPPP